MMETVNFAINIFFLLAAILDLVLMVKWDVQMLQQNSYRNERYRNWLRGSDEIASIRRVICMAVLVASLTQVAPSGPLKSCYLVAILAVVLLAQAYVLLKKKYKKPLVFTNRVKRLYCTELVLLALLMVLVAVLVNVYFAAVVAVFALTFSFAFTMAANWLLKPVENHINNGYIKDAERRLAKMPHLKVVGITGSYGKTSTKHFLNRILSEQYSVLMTPGSYNTPMGVTRTVRELMQPYNEIFICEMGAKNIGDIKEICDIVHPTIGIITAVGPQHLESFKTIENVQRTKFELIEALPANGLAVLNNDFKYVANRKVDNVTNVKRYGITQPDGTDFRAEHIKYSSRGTTFTVVGDGKQLELSTRLVGEGNISDLLAAVIVAMALGVPDEKIKYAVSQIEPVVHRLSMTHTASGITIIDDAYNSNPAGSKMALDVISKMDGGQRIVITPGMIELGDRQAYYNEQLGEHIAQSCDVAIVVGHYNRAAIMKGIKGQGMDKHNVHEVDTFDQAQALMLTIAKHGDIVLYENDLPDTFK